MEGSDLERKLSKLFGSSISSKEREAVKRTVHLYQSKRSYDSFRDAIDEDYKIRKGLKRRKREVLSVLSRYGRKKQEAISISDKSRSDNFNYKDRLEESEEEEREDWRHRRKRKRYHRTPSSSRSEERKRIKRQSMGGPIRARTKRISEAAPKRSALFNHLGGYRQSQGRHQMSHYHSRKDRPPYGGHHRDRDYEGRRRFEGGIPPPPRHKRAPYPPSGGPGRKDPFSAYKERKDCLIVRNIPKYYNSVNYLSKYFQKFGEIVNTSTFEYEKGAVIQYKTEEQAEVAMKAKSIPFGMRKIEISCSGAVKEYPAEPAPGEEEGFYSGRASYQSGYGGASSFEEKKSKWKDLQEGKKSLLQRMTTFVQLYLEIKLTKTRGDDKARVQSMISDIHGKMGRIHHCKDIGLLRNEYQPAEFEPLDLTMKVEAHSELDYSRFSKLLGIYGKVESLVISDSKKEATVRFSSISSSVRAYFDFKAKGEVDVSFEEKEIQKAITTL